MNTKRLSFYVATVSGLASLTCLGTPSPGPANEAERTDFVQVIYDSSPRLAESKIEARIDDHIATLTGTSDTIDEADYAVSIALATDGIFGVVNRIAINPDPDGSADLSTRTEAVFATTDLLDASNVVVTSREGAMTLEGTVSTFDERELARELASRINGVQEIENRLEISFIQPRSEIAIQKQLQLQFSDDPLFDLLPVNILVNGGTVTLNGSVGSLDEKERLMRTSLVTGVMNVDASKLEINSDLRMEGMADKNYQPSDSMKVARLVFDADPRVRGADIQLEMIGGTMILNGSVPNRTAIKAAEADARGVPGVLGVVNRLQVKTELGIR